MKNAIAIAGLSALMVSPAVLADYELYGRAHVALVNVDPDGGDSKIELESRASRVGIKGSTELTEGLDAIYKWESQIDFSGDNGGQLKSRNQFVGLKGAFGSLIGGIHDTPMKQAEGKIDLFSDREDIGKTLGHTIDPQEREKQFLGYYSPKFNNMRFALATMPGKSTDNEIGGAWSTSLSYGDKKLKKTPFFAAIAYDDAVDFGDDASVLRLSGQTKFGPATIGAIFEKADDGKDDHNRYVLSAKFKVAPKTSLLAQYVFAEELGNYSSTGATAGTDKSDTFALGVDHKLGKKTKVYLMGSQRNLGANSDGAGDAGSKKDTTFISVGIQHKFKL